MWLGVIGAIAALLLSGCTSDGASRPPPESYDAVVAADSFADMYEVGREKAECSWSPRVVVRSEGRVLGSPPAGISGYERAAVRVGDLVVATVHGQLPSRRPRGDLQPPTGRGPECSGRGVFRFRATEPGRAAVVVGMPAAHVPSGTRTWNVGAEASASGRWESASPRDLEG